MNSTIQPLINELNGVISKEEISKMFFSSTEFQITYFAIFSLLFLISLSFAIGRGFFKGTNSGKNTVNFLIISLGIYFILPTILYFTFIKSGLIFNFISELIMKGGV